MGGGKGKKVDQPQPHSPRDAGVNVLSTGGTRRTSFTSAVLVSNEDRSCAKVYKLLLELGQTAFTSQPSSMCLM